MQATRAIARGDYVLMDRAARALPLLKGHFAADQGGQLLVTNMDEINKTIAAAIRAALAHDDDASEAAPTRQRFKRQRRPRGLLGAWTRQWAPYAQRSALATIIDGAGDPHNDPADRARLLADHWTSAFARRDVHGSLANIPEPLPDPPTPTARDILGVMRRGRQSAPGPDGVPYAAWAAASFAGARILLRLLMATTAGGRGPPAFNAGRLVFLPKPTPSAPRDEKPWATARTPKDTRPLNLNKHRREGTSGGDMPQPHTPVAHLGAPDTTRVCAVASGAR